MMLHGTRGRVDAVQEVWRLLQARLAELDLDVEDATATLYRQLTSTPRIGNEPVERAPTFRDSRLPRSRLNQWIQ